MEDHLQETSAEEAVLELRRNAIGFAFPVTKAEWPLQQDNRLGSVPLRPLRVSKREDSNAEPLSKFLASSDTVMAERCTISALPHSSVIKLLDCPGLSQFC